MTVELNGTVDGDELPAAWSVPNIDDASHIFGYRALTSARACVIVSPKGCRREATYSGHGAEGSVGLRDQLQPRPHCSLAWSPLGVSVPW
jgi:hypothetical protein